MNAEQVHERLMERTLEVERSVLGGILVDPALLHDARARLTPSDFFRRAHQILFRALLSLNDSQTPIDTLSLSEALTAEELEQVGGPAYIAGLIDGVPGGLNVGYYAGVVKARSIARRIEVIGRQMVVRAQSGDDEPGAMLDAAERAIFRLRDETTTAEVTEPSARAAAAGQAIEALTAGKGALQGVATGLKDLDADLRGLRTGNLITVAGRPSMGKTAFGHTLAVNAAAEGSPALFFSLEMSGDELNLREVTMRARVNGWRLSHGYATHFEQMRLAEGLQALRDGNVYTVDAPLITVSQIGAISRRFKAAHGLSIVVIDYLQLLDAEGRRNENVENRAQELGAMTRSLKGIARDLRVPFVLLSQLNRSVEQRTDKRPQMSDLRESGSIEQDSDVVLLLCRPAYYREFAGKYAEHYVECNIAKQRNGPTGIVKLSFWRDYTLFTDHSDEAPTPEAPNVQEAFL